MILIFVTGCTSSQLTGNTQLDIPQNENTRIAKLEINEMTCPSCALGVEYQLKQVKGVREAKVDYQKGTGIVTYDPSKVIPEDIAKASTTYPAKVVE